MDAQATHASPTALDWSVAVEFDHDLTEDLPDTIPDDIEADAAAIVAALGVAPADADASEVTVQDATLTEVQRAILDFERQWWRRAGAKEQAIRDNFEMSPTRYYQTLNHLLDLPEALSYDPTLVHRLQRLRTSAGRARRLA